MKAVKEPEVVMEKPTQKDTIDQGLLDDGMSAFNMQEMCSVLTIPPSDIIYPDNQQEPNEQEPNEQQQETDYQNWVLPIPTPDPSQYWKQSEEFYNDPDGYCWLE